MGQISGRVYDVLSNTAPRILAQGCSVVLDAAYLRRRNGRKCPHLARLAAFASSACS